MSRSKTNKKPTSFTYAAEYVQLTGNIAGNLSLGASLGSMILPALAGKLIETSVKESVFEKFEYKVYLCVDFC